MVGERDQAARRENIDAGSGPGGFRAAIGRADKPLAERIGADRGRQRAGDRGKRAIEIELAEHDITRQRIRRDRTERRHQAERDRKVEMRSFLGQIGGSEIDGDLFRRHGEPGGMQCRLHPLAAFRHRLVRQADDIHVEFSGPDHDLHIDRNALYALKCNRADARDHETPATNIMSAGRSPKLLHASNCNLAWKTE